MGRDESQEDALLIEISELRQELIRWIDCQLNLCRQREARIDDGVPGAAAGPAPSRAEAEPVSKPPSLNQRMRDPTVAASDAPHSGDARDRLDALARQLGERLRLSEAGRKGHEKTEKSKPRDDRRGPAP
jgi:hypothetical protein